jgi:hypothetical protein
VALSLLSDELEKARRVLERGQAPRRPHRAARLGQPAARRNRSGRTDDAAEGE